MLSADQAKALTFRNFKDMGWTDEKAAAHADVSDAELAGIKAMLEEMETSPEERAAKKLDDKFDAIDRHIASLGASNSNLARRVAALEATKVQPAAVIPAKQPKKLNLSEEERQRRSERAKANFAARHEAQRLAASAGADNG